MSDGAAPEVPSEGRIDDVARHLDATLSRLIHGVFAGGALVILGLVLVVALAQRRWGLGLLTVVPIAATLWSLRVAAVRRLYRQALEVALWPTFVVIAVLVVAHGGLQSTAAWWLLVPPVAMLLGGAMLGGIAMGAATIALLLGCQWLLDPAAPSEPALLGALQPLLAIGGPLGAIGVLLVIAVRWRRRVLEQLARTGAEAQEAMEVKARFLANMSHEIRTPLNGIVGAGELMRLSALDPGQRQALQILEHSTRALLSVVNDVLDFSRLEAGQLQVERVELDPVELAHDAVEMFAAQADARGIELWAHGNADVPRSVCGDPLRLRQVLHNLLANAVKFTERGEVRLQVGIEVDPASAPMLRFDVRDTGIGIGPAQQSQLFQAFAQADGSTTRRYGGTGLGLAISRQLATLLGGRIDVESQPGGGSTFTLRVPALAAAPVPAAAAEGTGGGVAVLCRTAAMRADLCAWLAGLGATALASADLEAEQGLRAAHAAGARLVVADDATLRAAGLARSTWAERVREAGLGAVLLLGVSVPADGVPANLVPLYKPARPRSLESALRDACRLARAPAAPPRIGPASEPVVARAPRRVLVVEDNPVNRVIAQALLEQLGLAAETAEHGLDALTRLNQPQQRYDAVLMDCHMPQLDGLEATRRWRATEQQQGLSRLPIIAMTANSQGEAGLACSEAGMDDFIAKPFALADLHGVLVRWLALPPPAA